MDNSELSLSPEQSPCQSPRRDFPASPNTHQHENRVLKTRLYQIQHELQVEQDTVSSLRKKLNALEKDRLDAVGKSNDQVARTDSELTRMRAAVEKGEAVRQNLEYELAKLRRELGQEKRGSAERENLLGDVNESMKQKVSELSNQIEQLCQELSSSKLRNQEEIAKLNLMLNEKELHISSLRTQKDILEAEKEKAETALTQQEASVTDLEKRIKESEEERRSSSEGMRRQVSEVELHKEREQRFMRDLEAAMRRIKTLEESIEAERAAHLESKFNSEIIQLRIRDLEGALDVEKTSKNEALDSSEKLAKQIKELQQLYEDHQKESVQSREKLEKDLLLKCVLPATRAEKEYALINQQLQTDIEKKNHVVGKLSKQLELHQKNFDELKEELNKAKKRQIYLEETYGGSMRELELLLNNFNLETEGKRPRPVTKTRKKDSSLKNVAPSAVLENLRYTLLEYKQRLDQTATELTKLKSQHEQLAKECDSYKDMIWSKDKALENTSQGMTKSGKEVQRLRAEVADKDHHLMSSRSVADDLQQQLQKELSQVSDLKAQLVKIATKCKTDEQVHTESLHGLYQQLLTGRLSTSRHSTDSAHSRFSWNELMLMVQEEMANMMHSYHRATEKVQHIESLQESKEAAMKQMQSVHEDQLTKLAGVAEDKGTFWQQQKNELEEHYGQLIAEMHLRQKKLQSLTDQAWEKVRVTGTVQQGLEAEVVQLREQLDQADPERRVLLTACSLLCGALYPLYAQAAALAAQRGLLQDQVTRLEAFRLSVQKLVGALNMTGDGEGKPAAAPAARRPRRDDDDAPQTSPLLRFRAAAIAVIAANRLVYFAKGHCRLFTARDVLPGLYSMTVCTGGLQPVDKPFNGLASFRLLGGESMSSVTAEKAVSWLSSGELLSAVMGAMSDLQPLLNKARDPGSNLDMKSLQKAVSNSFTKLLCHLPSNFSSVTVSGEPGPRDRPALLRALGHGLRRVLARTALSDREAMVASEATLAALRHQVLDFTKRLHMAEVDRRDLRSELTGLRQERFNWRSSVVNSEHMSAQLTNFKDKVDSMVAREQFDEVCHELDQALSRERQAQELLQEQSRQIQALSQRYERQAAEGSQKEQSLSESLQNLTDVRQELKRQEQLVRQLSRQMNQLEHEKKLQQTNIADAENALRTAAKDKELVMTYVKAVEKTIDQCKLAHGKGPMDLTPILSPDLVPRGSGRTGPEMSACQLLVTAFVDAQAQLNSRVRSLQEEVTSHRTHVNSLKRELAAACKREFEDEMACQYNHREPTKDIGSKTIPSPPEGRNLVDFMPLEQDENDSFTALPRATTVNHLRSKYTRDKPAKTKKTKAKQALRISPKDSSIRRSAGTQRQSRPSAGSIWQSRTGLSSSLR